MLSRIFSSTITGISPHEIIVEVDISTGMIMWNIVGLPDTAIKESKQRISSALKNSGIKFPERKITVNLSPADMKKEGSLFDLPIMIGLLDAANIIQIPLELKEFGVFVGEVCLDGTLLGGRGILSMTKHAVTHGKKYIIVPAGRACEASLVKGIAILAPQSIKELLSWIEDFEHFEKYFFCNTAEIEKTTKNNDSQKSLDDIRGNEPAKRAAQIVAAGGHPLLLIGSPGSGKTMLAERISALLPEMSYFEKLAVTEIYSAGGYLKDYELVSQRPFQAPHHTISSPGLVGGGSNPQPGSITLAHKGVLFLDELLEFKKSCIELLRQPLESKYITISRAQGECTFPADFLLIAATNPCPCGFYGDERKECTCSVREMKRYLQKLSGPLLDRIDLHVGVYSAKNIVMQDKKEELSGKYSEIKIKESISQAREIQKKRYHRDNALNSSLTPLEIEQYCICNSDAQKMAYEAYEKLSLSMRGYHKILKIARTIADLDESEIILGNHIQEAIGYRILEKLSL